jgi:hypothetical protein
MMIPLIAIVCTILLNIASVLFHCSTKTKAKGGCGVVRKMGKNRLVCSLYKDRAFRERIETAETRECTLISRRIGFVLLQICLIIANYKC